MFLAKTPPYRFLLIVLSFVLLLQFTQWQPGLTQYSPPMKEKLQQSLINTDGLNSKFRQCSYSTHQNFAPPCNDSNYWITMPALATQKRGMGTYVYWHNGVQKAVQSWINWNGNSGEQRVCEIRRTDGGWQNCTSWTTINYSSPLTGYAAYIYRTTPSNLSTQTLVQITINLNGSTVQERTCNFSNAAGTFQCPSTWSNPAWAPNGILPTLQIPILGINVSTYDDVASHVYHLGGQAWLRQSLVKDSHSWTRWCPFNESAGTADWNNCSGDPNSAGKWSYVSHSSYPIVSYDNFIYLVD